MVFTEELGSLALSQIREKRRLKIIEEKMTDRFEERSEISSVLSEIIEPHRRKLYELRMNELGLEIILLWIEYRKLVGVSEPNLDSNMF